MHHVYTCLALLAAVLAVCWILDRIPGFNKAYDRIASTVIVVGSLAAFCYWFGGWASLFFLVPVLMWGNNWSSR